ncbi:glycosyltransferase family 39 protein, partial [bacterium]|nr:glycosyltransferase family 39 protein [candidate division CSSED10-310 bacterium]
MTKKRALKTGGQSQPSSTGQVAASPITPATTALADWIVRRYRLIFAAILLFTIATRFINLGHKPFHHDESLYSKYAYDYGKGIGHKYDPLMHGPFAFILNGTFMKYWDKVYVNLLRHFGKLDPLMPQSGYNDFTARLIPALLGIGIVLLCHGLGHHFGKLGALLAAIYFAVSPSFTYYTRFMRMDAYVLFENHLLIVGFLLFLFHRKWRYMYISTLGLTLFWCTKENHFVHTLEYLSFFIILELYKAFVPTFSRRAPGA